MIETTIVCIRHGESEGNLNFQLKRLQGPVSDEEFAQINRDIGLDPPLTERGKEQARLTGKKILPALQNGLKDGTVTIYCSPLTRAKDTCEIALQEIPSLFAENVIYLDDLMEYSVERQKTSLFFVEKVHQVFLLLQEKAATAKCNQTIVLFGHSWFFSTLFVAFSTHYREISAEEHKAAIMSRTARKSDPTYLNIAYRLPNCSINTAIAEKVEANEVFIDWTIHRVGKCDHLTDEQISTGNKTKF